VFCIYLRTNSDLCHLQPKLIGFCNRDEKCLQRGTDWVFKYSGLRFVFKRLNHVNDKVLFPYFFLHFFLVAKLQQLFSSVYFFTSLRIISAQFKSPECLKSLLEERKISCEKTAHKIPLNSAAEACASTSVKVVIHRLCLPVSS
jgi:hypothetical protein